MPIPVTVLDANVLYPAPLRDFLLWLAKYYFFVPKWTEEIHNEWMRNVISDRVDIDIVKITRTRNLMAKAFPEASVVGYESLIRKLTNDSKDRHVLAAAIQAEASCIVTFNLKDFKTQDLEPHRIVAIHPDDFILPFCQESVEDVLSMIREHRSYLRRPPKTALEYVDTLEKSGLVRVAAELRAYQDRM